MPNSAASVKSSSTHKTSSTRSSSSKSSASSGQRSHSSRPSTSSSLRNDTNPDTLKLDAERKKLEEKAKEERRREKERQKEREKERVKKEKEKEKRHKAQGILGFCSGASQQGLKKMEADYYARKKAEKSSRSDSFGKSSLSSSNKSFASNSTQAQSTSGGKQQSGWEFMKQGSVNSSQTKSYRAASNAETHYGLGREEFERAPSEHGSRSGSHKVPSEVGAGYHSQTGPHKPPSQGGAGYYSQTEYQGAPSEYGSERSYQSSAPRSDNSYAESSVGGQGYIVDQTGYRNDEGESCYGGSQRSGTSYASSERTVQTAASGGSHRSGKSAGSSKAHKSRK